MKTAMILAAGRGERLRPITDQVPKPLCKLGNQPLIGHHLLHLTQAGFQRVIINHAYLGWQIKQYIKENHWKNLEILYSPEPPGALETGGGIVNALPFLGTEPFLTLNGDIYCDYDLNALKLPNHSLAHVILVNKPIYREIGDYGLCSEGYMNNANQDYIFSGITLYHPLFFSQAKQGRYSVTPLIRNVCESKKITAELYKGLWFDIGSPEQLKLAEQEISLHNLCT